MRSENKARPSTLACQNALPRHFAKPTQVGQVPSSPRHVLSIPSVTKIDAVQAEYSAFETLHETDSLVETAKELGIAYVAYSPLGHGWLVDDFPYKTPDDFAPNDFRRTSTSPITPSVIPNKPSKC